MPLLLALLGIIVAGIVWYNRAQRAGMVAKNLADAANDVRLAARRFGFKQKANVHPIDTVEDPRLAAAGIVAATAQMDGLWDKSIASAMVRQAQSVFDVDLNEAEEIVVFARWIAEQGGTLHESVRRLARRLKKLVGSDLGALKDTVQMIRAVSGRDNRALSEDAQESIATVERILKKS